MVQVLELRILHPYTVEEFERGQTYGNMKAGEQLEGGGQGSTLISSDPYYDDVYGEGAFNRSITELGEGRLPAWLAKMFPSDALTLNEKCWTIFPYCKTSVSVPALQGLKCEVLSFHIQDGGKTENALRLPKDLLAKRKVEYIDIGACKLDPKDYREDRDPALVKSNLTGKGPLTPGWQEREKPIMCAYKVIIADFKYPGLSGSVESVLTSMMKKLFTLTHRTCFCTLDEWLPLSTEEVLDAMDRKRLAGGSKVVEVRRAALKPSSLLSHVALGGGEGSDSLTSSEAGSASEREEMEDGGDEEFMDAEMDWAMADGAEDPTLLTGAAPFGPIPYDCPGCVYAKRPILARPVMYCTNCTEFFCPTCFDQVHITPKLQQHVKNDLPTPSKTTRVVKCASVSLSGTIQHKISRMGGYRRESDLKLKQSESANGAPADGTLANAPPTGGISSAKSAQFASAKEDLEGVEKEEEEEEQVLSWDKVKDPPLNVFSTPSSAALPPHFGDPEEGNLALWLALLVGKESEESFVEVPEDLRSSPTDLSAAMVALLTAIYRTAPVKSAAGPPPPFPLAAFNPSWKRLAKYFPGFGDSESPGVPGESGSGSGGGEEKLVIDVLPQPTSDHDLEMQRLESARMYRALAEELVELDLGSLRSSPGFWINTHNAMLLHAYLVYGIPKSPQELSVLFQKASYVIGGVRFSASGIEESIIRAPDTSGLGRVMNGLPRVVHLKGSSDLLSSYSLTTYNPELVFTLSMGNVTSPVVRPYWKEGLQEAVHETARQFFEGQVKVEGGKVTVPIRFYLYRKEFGGKNEQLEVLHRLLPPDLFAKVASAASMKLMTRRLWDPIPHDFTFGYTFSRNG